MLIDKIKESILTGEPFLIKSYMDYSFDWEDMVYAISESYNTVYGDEILESENKTSQVFNRNHKRISRLNVPSMQPVSFHAQELLYVDNEINFKKYGQVKQIKNDLLNADLYADTYYSVHVKFSINLAENSPPVVPHRDTHHVLLTQAIGKAKYYVHESKETDPYSAQIDVTGREFKEYLLEKNDILFLPYGTIHSLDNAHIRSTCIFDIIAHDRSK